MALSGLRTPSASTSEPKKRPEPEKSIGLLTPLVGSILRLWQTKGGDPVSSEIVLRAQELVSVMRTAEEPSSRV